MPPDWTTVTVVRANTVEKYSCTTIDDYAASTGHRPLLGKYKIYCNPIDTPHKFVPLLKYRDIKLNQPDRIGELIGLLDDIDLSPHLDPGVRLLHIEQAIVTCAHQVFRPRPRSSKEGWSPRIRAHIISLQMIVRIKRHVYGHHHYSKWTEQTFSKGLRAILKSWRAALADLADTGDPDAKPFPPILDLANFGFLEETWHDRSLPEIRQVVIPAFLAVKKLLQGNIREDARHDFGGLRSRLQSEFGAGRIKPSIKTILSAKQKQVYTMEAVISQGITHT